LRRFTTTPKESDDEEGGRRSEIEKNSSSIKPSSGAMCGSKILLTQRSVQNSTKIKPKNKEPVSN
jgi:hypothetical protein